MKELSLVPLVGFILFFGSACSAERRMDEDVRHWYQCTSDSDCVIAQSACGWPDSVNRSFTKEFEDWQRKMAPLIECQESVEVCAGSEEIARAFRAAIDARCVENICKARYTGVGEPEGDCLKRNLSAFR